MNWEDLRYVLAVARSGTIAGAAKALGVNPTTVSRRLHAVEDASGTSLFRKIKNGVELTEAGDDMVAVAESMDRLACDLDARIVGRDTKAEGRVKVTSTDLLFRHFLPDLQRFAAEYPEIELELDSSTAVANLTQRESDVAIRLAGNAPAYLIGRKHARNALCRLWPSGVHRRRG